MRWVTLLAAGYALTQMLAYTDPARLPGLAHPAPWRPPGTRTAGLIQAGIARILREVGLPALIKAIPRKLPALDSLGTAASGPKPLRPPDQSRSNPAIGPQPPHLGNDAKHSCL